MTPWKMILPAILAAVFVSAAVAEPSLNNSVVNDSWESVEPPTAYRIGSAVLRESEHKRIIDVHYNIVLLLRQLVWIHQATLFRGIRTTTPRRTLDVLEISFNRMTDDLKELQKPCLTDSERYALRLIMMTAAEANCEVEMLSDEIASLTYHCSKNQPASERGLKCACYLVGEELPPIMDRVQTAGKKLFNRLSYLSGADGSAAIRDFCNKPGNPWINSTPKPIRPEGGNRR